MLQKLSNAVVRYSWRMVEFFDVDDLQIQRAERLKLKLVKVLRQSLS